MAMWTIHIEGGPRRVNHAAAAVGHLIFSFGGYVTGDDFDTHVPIDVHVLNTLNNRWERLPEPADEAEASVMPFRRFGHTVVAYKKVIYMFGGRNNVDSSCTLYAFHTTTRRWSRPVVTGEIPEARDGHAACVSGKYMYMMGGFLADLTIYSCRVHRLDLELMAWQVLEDRGDTPEERDFHTLTMIGSHMYVFGGRGDEGGQHITWKERYFTAIKYLDTDTMVWHTPQTTGIQPLGRRSHSTFVYKNRLYIFGGYNGILRQHFNDVLVFDPENNSWSELIAHGAKPCARRRQCCNLVDTKLYLFGGTSPALLDEDMAVIPTFDDSDDEDEVPGLLDHNDLHVLDLEPTLVTRSIMALLPYYDMATLESNLPTCLVVKIKEMVENNTISGPLE